MDILEKIEWLENWAAKNGAQFIREGTCGFSRPCVGISKLDTYPAYDDEDPAIPIPDAAYHKYPCLAVLGHSDSSIEQLYDWVKWFDDNGYVIDVKKLPPIEGLSSVHILLNKHIQVYMRKMGA